MSSNNPQRPVCARRLLAISFAALVFAPCLAQAAYRDDVGFTQLQAELGSSVPTGASVVTSQVEAAVQVAGQDTWVPDPFNAEFTGKTITQVFPAPSGISSGHATAVGQLFYGNTLSTSPAISSIAAYWVDRWVLDDFLAPLGNDQPLWSSSRIVNHSWIGAGSTTAASADWLRRLDWVIETDDQLHVAAHSASSLPNVNPLLSSGFNVIAAGRSDDTANTGSAAVDSRYIAGRARPDVVVPADSPSTAAPKLSSLLALLVQTGHAITTSPSYTTSRALLAIRNTERSQVIRAALMAGADRVTHNTSAGNLALYRDSTANQTGNGVDLRYGAGQVNIRNSYRIITSGERASTEDGGPGSVTATRGFDYDPAFGGLSGANSTANYPLPVSASPQLLTASLIWNIHIDGGTANIFNSAATLRDLALSVINVANPSIPVTVFTSQSTTENTEHAWLVIPAGGQYTLRVTRGSGSSFSYPYALAWQLLPDTDADGAHDGQDNCVAIANGPIIRDAGGRSQLDADGDGYGNYCDADLNNSGLVTAIDYNALRSAINTADPVADLNGSGLVTATDFTILQNSLNLAPGPSAVVP